MWLRCLCRSLYYSAYLVYLNRPWILRTGIHPYQDLFPAAAMNMKPVNFQEKPAWSCLGFFEVGGKIL